MDMKHAKLSASGSSKWLNCPGSINAEKNIPNTSSSFAQEGTLAHELGEKALRFKQDASYYIGKKLLGEVITKEMAKYVQEYLDYVRAFETKYSRIFIEETVDFSNFIPEGYGTLDAMILDQKTGICHIFDLKYGQGVQVSAVENTQAQLYALGVYNEFEFLDIIKSFKLHIVQPRTKNFSEWDISLEELLKFGEYAQGKAEMALGDNAPIVPGEKQCQWCRAKGTCKALYNFTQDTISAEFDNLEDSNSLSDQELKNILDNKKLIESFLKAVEETVYSKLSYGERFTGYKLVEGRSNRKWNEQAEVRLRQALGEDAYEKKLITITKVEKEHNDLDLSDLTVKPKGKITLAKDSDKRPSIAEDTINMFEEV